MCSVTPVRVVSCPGHRLISYFLDLISKQLRSSSALSRRQSERPLWRLLLLWLVLIQVGGREVPPLLLNFVPHIWLLDFREWISADGSCQRRFSIKAV